MIVELLAVAAVFVGGCALMRTVGVNGWSVAPLGFLAGLCLQILIGFVQVVTGLPTTPVLTLALTAAAPVAWWVYRLRNGHDVRVRVPYVVASLVALAAVVMALRWANLVKWHSDSLRYVMAGKLLADDNYRSVMSVYDMPKRLLGVPLLHAPASMVDEYYLRSLMFLLTGATVGVIIWLLRLGTWGSPASRRVLLVFVALGIAVLATNNRFFFSAFYLNGHLLVGALILVIAGAGWILAGQSPTAPKHALMLLQLLAVPALVVTRPEGPLIAGLVLLPTLLTGRIPWRHRAMALAVLAASTVAWHGFMVWVHLQRDVPVPVAVWALVPVGALLLLAIPLLRRSWYFDRHRKILWAVEAGLWLVLAAFVLRDATVLRKSGYATLQNFVFGDGKWGLSIVVLAIIGLAVLLVIRAPRQEYLRFPVTTFIPLAFVLAYVREGAYRVGYGDSLSRMAMHMVPLAVFYVVAATMTMPRSHAPIPAVVASAASLAGTIQLRVGRSGAARWRLVSVLRSGASARHRRAVSTRGKWGGSRRLAFALVLVAAILVNLVQFQAIDRQADTNYRAIHQYETSDIIDIGQSSARTRERTSMYVALGLIAPGSTVAVSRDGVYASEEARIGFYSFGKVAALLEADVPDEIPRDFDPMPFVVARGIGEGSDRNTPWAIAVDPSGVKVGDPDEPERFLDRAIPDRSTVTGPPRHFVLATCACADEGSITIIDMLIETSLLPTGAEASP